MDLHDLGEDVLENILCAVDPGIVHRFRLVCKKWKSIIDNMEHIWILLRFPSIVSQMEFHDLAYNDYGKCLLNQLQAAIQQRNLYLSSQDANLLLVLDRIFISEIERLNEREIKNGITGRTKQHPMFQNASMDNYNTLQNHLAR